MNHLKFLLALGAYACTLPTSTSYVTLVREGSFTEDQEELIRAAEDRWTEATGGFVTFTPDGKTGTIIFEGRTQAQLDAEESKFITAPSTHVAGFTDRDWDNSTIQIVQDAEGDTFQHIAEHEIGHALRLRHDGPDTVMYKDVDGSSPHVSCGDVKQFCIIWGCDPNEMPICNHGIEAPLKGLSPAPKHLPAS